MRHAAVILPSIVFACLVMVGSLSAAAEEPQPEWSKAHLQKPMSADETRDFIKRLARFVFENHLKKNEQSPQRGMIYEYLDMPRKGQVDQFVQGEALDTMHDGAWFAAAMVNAYRATGDPFYKEILTRWQLPFYCKMLNHSDTLFSARRNDAAEKAHRFNKEHAYQDGEKGFVPYWWDDSGSVSLERRRSKDPLGAFACTDLLAGKPNPQFLLSGYSHGSSNHLAQDLGVMLELTWLLLKDSNDDADKKLAAEVVEAAKNLHECRMRHHGHIPMSDVPAALATGNAELMKFVPAIDNPAAMKPGNHYYHAMYDFKEGQRIAFPGFADDTQYRYYAGIARHGGTLPKPLAFLTIYDAVTGPLLYRAYCDDAEVPAGINRFDLHPYHSRDGKPEDYRSDKKGPGGKPRPIGSRMGPQNMIACGWALQALKAHPGIWEERYKREFSKDLRVYINDLPAGVKEKPSDPTDYAEIDLSQRKLRLLSSRDLLIINVDPESWKAGFTLKFFSQPDAKGSRAIIGIGENNFSSANDKGDTLDVKYMSVSRRVYSVYIRYTHVNHQKPWANAVEHGRYSIQIGDKIQNIYLASSEAQVKARLEYELAGGLRTWDAIFRDKGYIPTGIGAGGDWDRFSDSGGYAHLISAASQWLLYLEGKSDWEMHKIPVVISNK